MSFEAWHPGVLVAGAVHPECREHVVEVMELFLADVARGVHPYVSTPHLAAVHAMRDAALHTNKILSELTT